MIICKTMGLDIGELPMSPRDVYMRCNEGIIHLHLQHPSSVVMSDPVALTSDQARELAGWLVKLANANDADMRGFDQAHSHDLSFAYVATEAVAIRDLGKQLSDLADQMPDFPYL